jgi:hypothetical protein
MQTQRRSVIESFTMTALGVAYATPLNWYFIKHVVWSSPWSQAFWTTAWLTILSFIAKYVVRRAFNNWDA